MPERRDRDSAAGRPAGEHGPRNEGRRRFLEATLGTGFAFTVAGVERVLTPAAARTAGAGFGILTPAEVATLERLGEVLVPGAAEAGIAHFVDAQLRGPAEAFLGTLRYVDWPAPFEGFYREALAAIEAHATTRLGEPFSSVSPEDATLIVQGIATAQPDGWTGPPAPLVYFVLRSDAVDVVYGTPAGFARLDVPYLAHIPPGEGWS